MNPDSCSTALFVKDISVSKRFYCDILGLKISLDFGKNVIFSNNLTIWEISENHIIPVRLGIKSLSDRGVNRFEIYFETEDDISIIFKRLKESGVSFLHGINEEPWGQYTIRFFDPDNHLIEIGESMRKFVTRIYESTLDIEKVSARTSVPVKEIERLLKIR